MFGKPEKITNDQYFLIISKNISSFSGISQSFSLFSLISKNFIYFSRIFCTSSSKLPPGDFIMDQNWSRKSSRIRNKARDLKLMLSLYSHSRLKTFRDLSSGKI